MPYVIAEPCIGVKDKACVEVCPVEAMQGEEASPQLYINPDQCIVCGTCEIVCPVGAIFEAQDLPAHWRHYEQINAAYFQK